MRKKIFYIIDEAEDNNKLSRVYDYLMLVVILASLVPLFFKDNRLAFEIIDKVSKEIEKHISEEEKEDKVDKSNLS